MREDETSVDKDATCTTASSSPVKEAASPVTPQELIEDAVAEGTLEAEEGCDETTGTQTKPIMNSTTIQGAICTESENAQLRLELAAARAALSTAQCEVETLQSRLTLAEEDEREHEELRSSHAKVTHAYGLLRRIHAEQSLTLRAVCSKNEELRQRLSKSEELRSAQRRARSARTPIERMMRRKFAEKVEELSLTHARTTARMLNVQKRCFEEELESLESEAHATVTAFERQMNSLREEAAARDEEYAREREAAYVKTAAVMSAVRRRIQQGDAALEKAASERSAAVRAASERHECLRKLVVQSQAAATDVEQLRIDIGRKDRMLDRLRVDLDVARTELNEARSQAAESNAANASPRTTTSTSDKENARPVNGIGARIDADKLSKILATVIADLADGGQGALV